MKILTVDDDDIALSMLNETLLENGYEPEGVTSGREALDRLAANPYRMVITDWEMPGVTGLDLCRAVRSAQFPSYIYAIMLTGHRSSAELVEGMSAGADDFIGKPFNPAELVVRVRAGERVLSLETRDVAMFAMAKLAESRDPETGAHLECVRNYCRALARHLLDHGQDAYAVDPSFLRLVFATSPLHDIGKIGIPDNVLLKPGRLSDREFEIMKGHTELGAATLNAALTQFPEATFLRCARDIAASHHEHFDGTGYPAGLVGTNIPLCGRVVALADVYDALTSKRIYKNAYAHDVAKSIIAEEQGSHFDPQIVAAFLANEDEFKRIHAHYAESQAA